MDSVEEAKKLIADTAKGASLDQATRLRSMLGVFVREYEKQSKEIADLRRDLDACKKSKAT
jgi:hypothetical protein